MIIKNRIDKIEINYSSIEVNVVINNLSKLSSKDIIEFFYPRSLFIPRTYLIKILKGVLFQAVKNLKTKNINSSEELIYRLNFYKDFTQVQLINLLILLDSDNKLKNDFYNDIWLLFLELAGLLKVENNIINELYEKSTKIIAKEEESFESFISNINVLFYDEKGNFDGVKIDRYREVLINSATANELREIGLKYEILIPKRIKKSDLIEIIVLETESKGTNIEGLKEHLETLSIILLQRYCKDHNIKASIELKKIEVLEYLIKEIKLNENIQNNLIVFNFDLPLRYHDQVEDMEALILEETKIMEIEENPVSIVAQKKNRVTEVTDENKKFISDTKSQKIKENCESEQTSWIPNSSFTNKELQNTILNVNSQKMYEKIVFEAPSVIGTYAKDKDLYTNNKVLKTHNRFALNMSEKRNGIDEALVVEYIENKSSISNMVENIYSLAKSNQDSKIKKEIFQKRKDKRKRRKTILIRSILVILVLLVMIFGSFYAMKLFMDTSIFTGFLKAYMDFIEKIVTALRLPIPSRII